MENNEIIEIARNNQDDINDTLPNWKVIGARAAATVCKSSMELKRLANAHEKFGLVDKLCGVIKSGGDNISTVRDYFHKITGQEPQQCPLLKRMLEENCVSKAQIAEVMDELLQFKKAIAANIVIVGAISSGVFITVQVIKLYQVFTEISEASNVLNESKMEFASIGQKIRQLGVWCTELQDMMGSYETACTQDHKSIIVGGINKKVRRMNALYVQTERVIGAVKLRIDGKIHTLTVYRGEQGMDAISSAVQGATNTVQLVQLKDLLSPTMFALQACIAGAFFVLAAVSARACYVTQKKLVDLREAMNEIRAMEMQLEEILLKINNAEDWLDEDEHQ